MPSPKQNESKPRSQKTKPVVQTFEFITLTNNHKIDEHDRYTVRKQAMKNNTNRRIKGAKSPQEKEVESEEQLTGPPVIQQSLQSKRFRLLPRGLQDHDKPRTRLPSTNSDASNPLNTRMQVFQVMPQYSFGGAFTLDPGLVMPVDSTRKEDNSGEAPLGFGFVPQIYNSNVLNHDTEIDIETPEEYDTNYRDHIFPSIDPMAWLPDDAPYRTRLLVHHNFTERNRATSLMMSVRKSWFVLALTDLALFNVVLSHYAGIYCLSTGAGDPMESVSFTTASIKIVNERLGLPEQRTSDGTIAAVAGMVLQEIKNGNAIAVKAHLSGLEQMTDLRGGLLNASFPTALQRMIAWAELNASSVFSTVPHILPYASPALDIPSYICTARSGGSILPSSPCANRKITWENINTDIEQVFADLRYISSILESDDLKNAEQIDNMWYSDKTYLVQRSLVYLYQHPRIEHSRLDSLRCLAASIYVDSCLRDQGFRAGAIGILVSKLKAGLESFLLSYDREPVGHGGGDTERKQMWVCAFGAIAAYGRPTRSWFIERFANVCGRLGITEWPEAEGLLGKTLWNGRWEDPKGALWRDLLEWRGSFMSVGFLGSDGEMEFEHDGRHAPIYPD